MQKQISIVFASLAFLSGCGGNNKEVASPIPFTAATPDAATGEKVYKSTCSICHKSGLGGAPRIGNKEDWESRLAQGKEVLYDHAINGYRGSKGSMPSRGSNLRLSDGEVKAAVDYMVVYTIPNWTWEK